MHSSINPLLFYTHLKQISKEKDDITVFSFYSEFNEYDNHQSAGESTWINPADAPKVDTTNLYAFIETMDEYHSKKQLSTELYNRLCIVSQNIFNPTYKNKKYQLAFLTWIENQNLFLFKYLEVPNIKQLVVKSNELCSTSNNILNIYTNQLKEDDSVEYDPNKVISTNAVYNMKFINDLVYSMRISLPNTRVTNMYDLYSLDDNTFCSATSKWNQFVKKYFNNKLQDKSQIIISNESLQSDLKDANIPAISLPLNYFM